MMNRSIRHLLDALLSHNGYHVLLAENGEKGFELFRRERPDVIVLDLKMPEMDGLTVLRHIRSLNLAQPVIIYSGAWTPRRSSRLGPLGLLRASQRTARWFIWDCAAWGLKLSSRKKKDVAEGKAIELHLSWMKGELRRENSCRYSCRSINDDAKWVRRRLVCHSDNRRD